MPYTENFAPHTLKLDDGTSIWRYVAFPSFVSLLQRRELFFSKLATLAEKDPYEGKFSQGIIAELAARYRPEHDHNKYPDGITAAHAIEKRNRQCRAVNCWHMNETQSAAMWKPEQYQLFDTPEYTYRVFVTNMDGRLDALVGFYRGRASAENPIKEVNRRTRRTAGR